MAGGVSGLEGTPSSVVRGVGAAAADVVAQAAEFVAALARGEGQSASAAQAQAIAARAASLSVSNELAFTRAWRELDASIKGQRDEFELTRALERAGDVPLQVCLVARDLTLLAAQLAEGAMSARATDLCGVAQLAAGACSSAALLVRANVRMSADDPRRSRADATMTEATATARRVLEDLTSR
jgi:formiminotetrahydrofolate cyclodeaminase